MRFDRLVPLIVVLVVMGVIGFLVYLFGRVKGWW